MSLDGSEIGKNRRSTRPRQMNKWRNKTRDGTQASRDEGREECTQMKAQGRESTCRDSSPPKSALFGATVLIFDFQSLGKWESGKSGKGRSTSPLSQGDKRFALTFFLPFFPLKVKEYASILRTPLLRASSCCFLFLPSGKLRGRLFVQGKSTPAAHSWAQTAVCTSTP